jgi:hypothetical protein
MRRIRITGLLSVAAIVLGAAFASSASAVLMETVRGMYNTGVHIGLGMTLIFATTAGNIECSNATLNGTLLTNGAKTVKASITEASFAGEEAGGACKTTTPFGPATITTRGFPWAEQFKSNGAAMFKGTKKVVFEAVFPAAGGASCTFESSKVAEAFTPGTPTEPQPLVLTVAGQKFKLNKKTSNAACPKEGTLSGPISVTGEGETLLDS